MGHLQVNQGKTKYREENKPVADLLYWVGGIWTAFFGFITVVVGYHALKAGDPMDALLILVFLLAPGPIMIWAATQIPKTKIVTTRF